jgi:alpha-N-arabinofuranosidase
MRGWWRLALALAVVVALATALLSMRARDRATPERSPSQPALPPLTAQVEVDATRKLRQIPRTLYGADVEWVWDGYRLWQPAQDRADPEVVRLTRELGVTVMRYPGGYRSDFYHWRAGVGPREQRTELLHEPGSTEKSRPEFGTGEVLRFAGEVGAEVLLTVNAGTGTAREAADWVRHVNASGLRVRYWEVGNELYIDDGSAISQAIHLSPEAYAERFLEFARAMREADPRIRIGAIGGRNQGRYAPLQDPRWNQVLLARAADEIDFLAVHNAYAPVLADDKADLRSVYRSMMAAPSRVAGDLEALTRELDAAAPRRRAPIEIAVTEWGPFFQADPRGRYADHNKTLGSALLSAALLQSMVASPRTTLACFHALNELSMMGWLGSQDGAMPPRWAHTARSLALQLFTRHFGDTLVASRAEGPTFDTTALGWMDAARGVPYLQVVASLGSEGRTAHLIAVNSHFDQAIDATISFHGFQPAGGTAWTLTGTGLDAHTGTRPINAAAWGRQAEDEVNPRFAAGGPGEVHVTSAPVPVGAAPLGYRFPPHSVTALVLESRTAEEGLRK